MLRFTMIALALLVVFYQPQATIALAPIRTLNDYSVPELIEHYFPQNADLMTAIFKAESGLNENAVGYNCHYYKENGTRYSKACNKEDRYRAWSVDCGITQINTKGSSCPEELLDPANNIFTARKKYEAEGLKAWVVYKTGGYKKYLSS